MHIPDSGLCFTVNGTVYLPGDTVLITDIGVFNNAYDCLQCMLGTALIQRYIRFPLRTYTAKGKSSNEWRLHTNNNYCQPYVHCVQNGPNFRATFEVSVMTGFPKTQNTPGNISDSRGALNSYGGR